MTKEEFTKKVYAVLNEEGFEYHVLHVVKATSNVYEHKDFVTDFILKSAMHKMPFAYTDKGAARVHGGKIEIVINERATINDFRRLIQSLSYSFDAKLKEVVHRNLSAA